MNEIFTFVEKNHYNLRSSMHLSRMNLYSRQHSTEAIGNLGVQIWNLVPAYMKHLKVHIRMKKGNGYLKTARAVCAKYM